MSFTESSRSGGIDLGVYLACSLIGYFVALLLPQGALSVYVPILVSYHLFLAWLVISADYKVGLSLPISQSILTHLACVAVLVSLAIGRHYIPFFGLIRYLIPTLAPFECDWLFSGGKKKDDGKEKDDSAVVPATAAVFKSTAEDDEAWHHHLANRKSSSSRAGVTIQGEYREFVIARQKNRSATPPVSSSV